MGWDLRFFPDTSIYIPGWKETITEVAKQTSKTNFQVPFFLSISCHSFTLLCYDFLRASYVPDTGSQKTDQTDTTPALLELLPRDPHNPVAFLELPL